LFENIFEISDVKNLGKQLDDVDTVFSGYNSLTTMLAAGKDSGLSDSLFGNHEIPSEWEGFFADHVE
jgi:hypothetical protein